MITAYARAQESRRPDAVFHDPWAEALIRAAAGSDPGTESLPRVGPARDDDVSPLWAMLTAHFGAGRTPFFDDAVRTGLQDGAEQVVVLAAGMDARAVRIPRDPGTPLFEIDTAPVLAYKDTALTAAGLDRGTGAGRVPVAADLREDWRTALTDAGFRPGARTVWLIEGLLMYLDGPGTDRLLTDVVSLSGPGSRVSVEYFRELPTPASVPAATDTEEQQALDMFFTAFGSGPSDGPQEWFARNGLEPWQVTSPADELLRLGRGLPEHLDPSARRYPTTISLATGAVRDDAARSAPGIGR